MDPMVASAWIAAGAAIFGVGATAIVAIVGYRVARSTSQEAIRSAERTTQQTLNSARQENEKTVQAAHDDVRRTLEATRAGQTADLYSRAIDQLGSDKLHVRIGAIHALERIARDSKKDHPIVMDVLTAFIRESSRERWPPPERGDKGRWTRADVQAAVTVVGHRDIEGDADQVDLYGAILPKADLRGVKFDGATLHGADLTEANLINAHLVGAVLLDVTLDGARLDNADLEGALWSEDKPIPKPWKTRKGADGFTRLTADH